MNLWKLHQVKNLLFRTESTLSFVMYNLKTFFKSNYTGFVEAVEFIPAKKIFLLFLTIALSIPSPKGGKGRPSTRLSDLQQETAARKKSIFNKTTQNYYKWYNIIKTLSSCPSSLLRYTLCLSEWLRNTYTHFYNFSHWRTEKSYSLGIRVVL